jgi:hypothetical protein
VTPATIQAAALAYYDAGASVIPVATDATKRPVVDTWTPYQSQRPTRQQIIDWFSLNSRAIGVISGAVSGGREGIDIDNHPAPGCPSAEDLINDMANMVDVDAPGLWDRLAIEASPSDGAHILYRCPGAVEGNLKLARRAATAEELDRKPEQSAYTMIETRGEGGYFVSAPSPGYRVLQGDPTDPPLITPEERAILFRAARALNLLQVEIVSVPITRTDTPVGDRPGDRYNDDMSADDVMALLERHGWKACLRRRDGTILMRRPGKAFGWSATLGYGGTNLLRVFSTSADPFVTDKSYQPFSVRALLEFNGNFTETTRAVVNEGYGLYRTYTGPMVIGSTPIVTTPTVDPLQLPAGVLQPEAMADLGCPWLDAYISYSRHWSPRSFDGFHEAVGVWVLSTVAARRVMVHFGKEQFTPLFIALAGRSTIHAKTTAAEIGIEVLAGAGLDWMLADDTSTPQKFIRDRTQHVPENYKKLTGDDLRIADLKMKFAGQVGWWYDEFGMLLHAMARAGGNMSDFSGLLRRFDDCAPKYVYSTIGRPTDKVMSPYLALLASLTPADLRPLMRKGSAGWSDGFWARWAFVTPPADEMKTDRFPAGQREAPHNVTKALRDWHTRLGTPDLWVPDDDNPQVGPLPHVACSLAPGVGEAYYAYNDAIMQIIHKSIYEDLDAWHGRCAIRALRMAALFASLDGTDEISLRHWARAQHIAERWRFSLYRLYEQVIQQADTEKKSAEETVLSIIERLSAATIREMTQRIKWLSAGELQDICEKLVRAGMIEAVVTGRTTRFRFPVEDSGSVEV